MSDLAKNNNGNGTTDKIETTGLSAAELYRLGRALCFGVYGVKIDKGRGVAILEAAVEAGKAADASEETRAAALDAQAELAEQLSEDFDGRSADWERAVELAAKPAEAGNPFALFTLGNAASEGVGGVEADETAANAFYRRAVAAFLKRAKDGETSGDEDPRAICFAAFYLNKGRFVERDAAEAVRLYRRSAEIGCAEAALNLGVAWMNGDGVEANPIEGARWIRISAEAGDSRAAATLGELYWNGVGVEENKKEAARWFRKAAEAGDGDAAFRLGDLCAALGESGEDGELRKDGEPAALRWWRRGAELGNADATARLGFVYFEGLLGVEKDEAEGVRWFRRAVELGSRSAATNLGTALLQGVGVEADAAEGLRYLKLAVERGDATAANALGFLYSSGDLGVERDDAEAVRWFRAGVELGDVDAALTLAACFENGDGVERDDAEALRLYRIAAEAGNAAAACDLGARLVGFIDDFDGETDEAEGLRWLRRSAELGFATASFILGCCCENGVCGVEKNAAEAVERYREAAERGDDMAANRLAKAFATGDADLGLAKDPA